MKKKILVVYHKRKINHYNAPLHTGFIKECAADYTFDFWGRGFGFTSLRSLKRKIDRFKPDYLYFTVRGRYEKWLPDITSVQVPKIMVEVDSFKYEADDPWYGQFDKLYIRNRWAKPGWESFPLFRWSIAQEEIQPTDHIEKSAVRFVGSLTADMYAKRQEMQTTFKSVDFVSARDNEQYWSLLRSSKGLICPTDNVYGSFIPGKILEYAASGAAVITNCDLAGYGMPDLDESVIKYNSLEELKRILESDISHYMGKTQDAVRNHVHRIRYKELFD